MLYVLHVVHPVHATALCPSPRERHACYPYIYCTARWHSHILLYCTSTWERVFLNKAKKKKKTLHGIIATLTRSLAVHLASPVNAHDRWFTVIGRPLTQRLNKTQFKRLLACLCILAMARHKRGGETASLARLSIVCLGSQTRPQDN